MERVRVIAAHLAERVGLEREGRKALDRAALLCKADLTTQMVADISELQGTMGREYALAGGESAEVAEAIAEHYRPRFAGDDIPQTRLGRLLSVADRLDTIAACFAIGMTPTGSTDPLGLRREAAGVVSIVWESGVEPGHRPGIPLYLWRALGVALKALEGQTSLERPAEEVIGDLMAFFEQRLATTLRERGVRYDLAAAAAAVGVDEIHNVVRRALALQSLSGGPEFLPTVIATTRAINITRGFSGGSVNPELFQEEAEKALWEAYSAARDEVAGRDMTELFGLFSQLRAPIDRFFDEVLVMHEDERIRHNRLAICYNLTRLFRLLADFSLIVQG